jgi:hypothetical protein
MVLKRQDGRSTHLPQRAEHVAHAEKRLIEHQSHYLKHSPSTPATSKRRDSYVFPVIR